ncbi:hypothetical protein D3C86_1587070 [compost metagenome]
MAVQRVGRVRDGDRAVGARAGVGRIALEHVAGVAGDAHEHFRTVVARFHLARGIHLQQLVAGVALVQRTARRVERERHGARLQAGEDVVAVAVVGVGQAHQLVELALQRGGQRRAVVVAHGAVTGVHQHGLDALDRRGDGGQRVVFQAEGGRGLPARRGVLGIHCTGLRHTQRARGGHGVVGRRQDAAAGA